MATLLTKKSANKIVYVHRWMIHHLKDEDYKSIEATQLANGKWTCEIGIPLTGKTVKSTSLDKINAMINAADKATKVIQDYLKQHPEIKWYPLSKFRHWEIGYGEHNLVEINLENSYREKMDIDIENMKQESVNAVKKAIVRIERVTGVDKQLFIQVIDRALFDKDDSDDDIFKKIFDTMYEEHNIYLDPIQCLNDGDRVIVIGYTVPKEMVEEYLK